jgi:hypothetical protein
MANKFVYYNDTPRIVGIHPATITHGCDVDMSAIQPGELRTFILPEGTYPWVKMWDYAPKGSLQILVSPHSESDDGFVKHEPVEIDPVRKAMIEQSVKELFKKRDPHNKEEK